LLYLAAAASASTLACGTSKVAPAAEQDAAADSDAGTDAAAESGPLLEHFDLHFDPSSPTVLTVTRMASSASPGALTVAGDADVMGSATWNADTGLITANLQIANHGTWNWDEPAIVVVAIATDAAKLQVLEAAGRAGTFSGTGGVGSSWEFSDVEAAGKHASASQTIAVYDPEAKAATISVDIVAARTLSVVSPDKDGDGFNAETGPAGSDCNDDDATRFPGGGVCTCATACPGASGAAACGAGQCCTEVLEASATKRNCTAGCLCDVDFEGAGDNTLSCDEGSVCRLTSSDQTSALDICSGAVCDFECRSTTSPMSARCSIGLCKSASCSIHAGGAARIEITACSESSTCVVGCAPGAECHLTCTDESSDCRMTNCGSDNCFLDCPSSKSTTCGTTKVCGGPERC
jgi:hypothetical protein